MNDQEIQPGARVRVAYEAVYVRDLLDGWRVFREPSGETVVLVPPGAEVEVLAPPLPPEPPVGSWVEWQLNDPSGWPIALQRRQEPGDGTVSDRWWSGAGDAFPWSHLHEYGTVTRLHRDGDQPDGPATSDGRALWLHTCDHRTEIPVARTVAGYDPNDPPHLGSRRCDRDCPDPDAAWTPLYVEVERSDG